MPIKSKRSSENDHTNLAKYFKWALALVGLLSAGYVIEVQLGGASTDQQTSNSFGDIGAGGDVAVDQSGGSVVDQQMTNSPGGVQAGGDVTVHQAPSELSESLERIEDGQRQDLERDKRLDEKLDKLLATIPTGSLEAAKKSFVESNVVFLSAPNEVAARDTRTARFSINWNAVQVRREANGTLSVEFGYMLFRQPSGSAYEFKNILINVTGEIGREYGLVQVPGGGLVMRVVAAEDGGVAVLVGVTS